MAWKYVPGWDLFFFFLVILSQISLVPWQLVPSGNRTVGRMAGGFVSGFLNSPTGSFQLWPEAVRLSSVPPLLRPAVTWPHSCAHSGTWHRPTAALRSHTRDKVPVGTSGKSGGLCSGPSIRSHWIAEKGDLGVSGRGALFILVSVNRVTVPGSTLLPVCLSRGSAMATGGRQAEALGSSGLGPHI